MRKNVYSPEQREEALRMSEEIGPTAAARKLGIPPGTVYAWRFARSEQQGATESEAISEIESNTGQPERPAEVAEPTEASPNRKRVAKIYTPSQRVEILEYADKHGITEASRRFGATRFSIYNWRHKVKLHAEGKAQHPLRGYPPRDRQRRGFRLCS